MTNKNFSCPHCGEKHAAGERPDCDCVEKREKEREALREEREPNESDYAHMDRTPVDVRRKRQRKQDKETKRLKKNHVW